MDVRMAQNVGPSRIDIAYECFGAGTSPPVLMIMGLGGQMLGWHEDFCEMLARRGLRVIRFDNRDVGLSTHFTALGAPDLGAGLAGDLSSAAYGLKDMADDAVGLLDALQIDSVHLVGASMGGQIAQIVATEYPRRARSLTSMMSTTGAPAAGPMDPAVMKLFALPPPRTREEAASNAVEAYRVIGSPGFPADEDEVRDRARLAFDRGYDLQGLQRQGMAAVVSGDRTDRLGSLRVPTLVIHGAADRMCTVSGGEATAAAIPGAELFIIAGMGHNLPRGLWPRLTTLITDHVQRAERMVRPAP
jgi:pimeloyl-ACP methyl ester carboxylesterase